MDREERKGKLRDREDKRQAKDRLRKGFYGIGKQDSEVQGILLEAESRRLGIVTDPQFWKPIDTVLLDTSQADRILDLYRWEMDRLGLGLIQAVDRRIWKVKNGGHAKGPKAQAKGPKRREAVQGTPSLAKASRPGKPKEKGKRRYKPTKPNNGSAFDKVDSEEARSAALLWLVDTLDGKQASLYAQARGARAWLSSLSGKLQRDRLEACRQAYFVQDNGLDALPIHKLRAILDGLPKPSRDRAWGYDTMQHTCKHCGKKYFRLPEACTCGQADGFRSEPIGPLASLLKAVAQAVGKALSKGKLRFPGQKPDRLALVSLDGLGESESDESDGKPNRWEAVQESRYRNIDGKALCRLVLQEAQADPKADRLVTIIRAKLRGLPEKLALQLVRRKLEASQAAKLEADPKRLRKLGVSPPKYSRQTFYNDLREVRTIGKMCRSVLEAQAVQESLAWVHLEESKADKPLPIRIWYREKYRMFRRLRKQGLASELSAFLDLSKAKADPKESRQAQAVQEALRYCRYWASHAFDRRLLVNQDYPTDRIPDPEACLQARSLTWDTSKSWLVVQEADKPKPIPSRSQADIQAQAAKRQALAYCRYWASHAFDRRLLVNPNESPESFLDDFNSITWDRDRAWLHTKADKAAKEA